MEIGQGVCVQNTGKSKDFNTYVPRSELGTEEPNRQKFEKPIWSFKNNKAPRNASLDADVIKSAWLTQSIQHYNKITCRNNIFLKILSKKKYFHK